MRKLITLSGRRPTKVQKLSTAGIAVSAAALTLTAVPGIGDSDATNHSTTPAAASSAFDVKATDVEGQRTSLSSQSDTASASAKADEAAKKLKEKQKTAATDMAKAKKDYAEQQAEKRAERLAEKRAQQKKQASRSAERPTQYADNLDGWIKESLAIMKKKGIPGSYEGIHRNVMRESGGDPKSINDWDVNAANGVPSKGLLQVIKPTFDAYHVDGTAWDQYDPVANITAACNYAADRYGSIDNVDSAY